MKHIGGLKVRKKSPQFLSEGGGSAQLTMKFLSVALRHFPDPKVGVDCGGRGEKACDPEGEFEWGVVRRESAWAHSGSGERDEVPKRGREEGVVQPGSLGPRNPGMSWSVGMEEAINV